MRPFEKIPISKSQAPMTQKRFEFETLNLFGFIPRGLPRLRHSRESGNPGRETGFRVKHGMTSNIPLLVGAKRKSRFSGAAG